MEAAVVELELKGTLLLQSLAPALVARQGKDTTELLLISIMVAEEEEVLPRLQLEVVLEALVQQATLQGRH
jgi:hypothetical protein